MIVNTEINTKETSESTISLGLDPLTGPDNDEVSQPNEANILSFPLAAETKNDKIESNIKSILRKKSGQPLPKKVTFSEQVRVEHIPRLQRYKAVTRCSASIGMLANYNINNSLINPIKSSMSAPKAVDINPLPSSVAELEDNVDKTVWNSISNWTKNQLFEEITNLFNPFAFDWF